MFTTEMKELLKKLSDLCCKVSEEVCEDEETKKILNACDDLQEMIDEYLA